MLKKVKLYGELAEKYGKDWLLDINSPSEAVRALCANNPSFKDFVGSSQDRGVGYKVMVGKTYIEKHEEVYNPSGKQEIKIIPVILGAKKEGLGAIILGIALIAMGVNPTVSAKLAAAFGGGTAGAAAASMLTGAMVSVGVSLTMGGIAQLLAPTPEEVKEGDNYGFNGAVNTVRQGVPVPICYGQLMIGGAVISSGITNENYSP